MSEHPRSKAVVREAKSFLERVWEDWAPYCVHRDDSGTVCRRDKDKKQNKLTNLCVFKNCPYVKDSPKKKEYKTMTDREVNVKIIDLLMDTIGELIYALDCDLDEPMIETDEYQELRMFCNERFGVDFPAPLDLIGHVTQVRDLVDVFLLEKSKKVNNG